MDPRLHSYLQHLLETAHHLDAQSAESMPAPLAEKMLEDLRIQLEQRLMVVLLDKLSDVDQQAYADLIETEPAQEAVMAFLNSKVPGAADIVSKTLTQFKQDYIAAVNYGNK